MKRKPPRILAIGLISAVVLLVVAAVSLSLFLQTQKFPSLSRERVISAIERATGTKVELGSVSLDWSTFTVKCEQLVVHGTEPPGTPPLLRIASLRIELSWQSLLARAFDANQITVTRPDLHLLLHEDGSTNLPKTPGRAGSVFERLFDLRVKRYELITGTFAVNRESRAFSLRGENLRALLTEGSARPAAYSFEIGTARLSLKARCCKEWPIEVSVRGVVEGNSLRFDSFHLNGHEAVLQASGTLRDFAQPVAQFNYRAETTATALSNVAEIPELRGGDFEATGVARFNQQTGLTATGSVQGHRVSYVSHALQLANSEAQGSFRFANEVIEIQPLRLRLLGGSFLGQGTLRGLHLADLRGQLSGIELREAAKALRANNPPWQALLSGSIALNTSDGFRARLLLQPQADRSRSLSGHVTISARTVDDLRFEESQLNLARTHLDFSGSRQAGFALRLSSYDLEELRPLFTWLQMGTAGSVQFPELLPGGEAQFTGTLRGALANQSLQGTLAVNQFRAYGRQWREARWQGEASPDSLDAAAFSLDGAGTHVSGKGHVALQQWRAAGGSAIRLRADFRGLDLAPFWQSDRATAGPVAEGTVDLSGTIGQLAGNAQVLLTDVIVHGEPIPRVRADLSLAGNRLHIARAVLGDRSGNNLSITGDYAFSAGDWRTGEYTGSVRSEHFELSHVNGMRQSLPDWNGVLAAQATLAASITPAGIRPTQGRGFLSIHDLSLAGEKLGNLRAQLETQHSSLELTLTGDVRGNAFTGDAAVQLGPHNPVKGSVEFSHVPLTVLHTLFFPDRFSAFQAVGFTSGRIAFEGALDDTAPWQAAVHLSELQASRAGPSSAYVIRNASPVALEISNGAVEVQNLQLRGPNTELAVSGSFYYRQLRKLNLAVNGSASLQLLTLLDPGLAAAGKATINASVHGTIEAPALSGDLHINDGSIVPPGLSNSLSRINGDLTFDQDRATIRSLTAETGGGQLTLGGFISFAGPSPPSYHVDAHAQNTRLRSASGISVTANAALRLTGTSTNSLLAGTVTVSRAVFTPNTDVGNLLSSFAAPAPAGQGTILHGLQMDLAIQSAANLQVSTALSRDMGADVNLHLRGSPDHPVLLGSISANQGEIRVFGTLYTISRGEVSFVNPASIDPVLDLDLQTEARGINVDITISGTFNRLNVNYRSDPPLQPRDIIALLAVGRTPQEAANVQTSQVGASDISALQAGASSVLGQAISPPANRLSKLFGVTNIKLDPLVQGITSTPQSRLTLEQQISRAITVTYVTNLEQTSEQIFRLEWAVNREYSVVAVRDDNGEFGIDFQYKRRFK